MGGQFRHAEPVPVQGADQVDEFGVAGRLADEGIGAFAIERVDVVRVAAGADHHDRQVPEAGVGADFAQGWFYGPPVTLEELLVQVRADRTAIMLEVVARPAAA